MNPTGSSNSRHDVVVIGSGIGGLVAALLAARAGHRVLVLEAADQLGGYLNPFRRRGFSFDPGLHYVGEAIPPGSLGNLLRELQLDVTFNELSPDGFDWYVFPEYQVQLCKGIDRFFERLRADFVHQRGQLERFFALLRDIERAFVKLNRATDGPVSVLRALRHLPPLLRWSRATLRELLDDHFDDPLLKCALAGPCGDLGLPPSRLSAVYHMGLLCHFLGGAYYPRGGSGALRDAFVAALQARGATLIRSAAVERIVHRDGRVSGVVTADGALHRASAVISNAEAAATYRMAGLDRESSWLRRKLAATEPSCSSFIVFVGLEGELAGCRVGDRNVWHYGSSDIEALYRPVLRGELPTQEMVFITVPSLKDPLGGHAPEGHHVVQLVTFASARPFRPWFDARLMRRGDDYEALKQRLAEPMLAVAERYIPQLRRRAVLVDASTPATNAHYLHNGSGAIYGPAHTPAQVLLGRYSPRTALAGLFLCGSSVIGAGIAPCAHSGYLAARLARRYLARAA